jgi:hypothetical protein
MILFDSDAAAMLQTGLSGWVSGTGFFYGKDERAARYAGCTHTRCTECGTPIFKSYTACESCREKRRTERFNAFESRPWSGNEPVCVFGGEEFFFDEESFLDWCDADDLDPTSVRLVFADPERLPEFGMDNFVDYLPSDCEELPAAIQEAVNALNAAIKANGPMAWVPGKVRAVWIGGEE